jgi:hypothetical protein
MSGHGEKKSRKRELAIAALLSERTVEAAAAKAGVAYRTLKTWLAQPDFLVDYRQARQQVVEAAVGRTQQACCQAVDALVENLSCDNAAARNAAAKGILEMAVRGVELTDILESIEELKRQVGAIREQQNQNAAGETQRDGGFTRCASG